jgi:hypothetical protein
VVIGGAPVTDDGAAFGPIRPFPGKLTLSDWSNLFLGELGAAAALAGQLFVSASVNQTTILELGRMAGRGLDAPAWSTE